MKNKKGLGMDPLPLLVKITPPTSDCDAVTGADTIVSYNGQKIPGVKSVVIKIDPISPIAAKIETYATFEEFSAKLEIGVDTLSRWAEEAGYALVLNGD